MLAQRNQTVLLTCTVLCSLNNFLQRLLAPDPSARLDITTAFKDTWLNEGQPIPSV